MEQRAFHLRRPGVTDDGAAAPNNIGRVALRRRRRCAMRSAAAPVALRASWG
jgi:hypothetical protein